MKYIYVVTRTVTDDGSFGTAIPNLGVHTSLKRAIKHYESVLDSRRKEGATIHWNTRHTWMSMTSKVERIYEAYITVERHHDKFFISSTENLFIERWKV